MTPLDRISLASRLFCLSAALVLSALSRDLGAAQFAVLLSAIGVTAWWLSHAVVLNHAWAAAVEGMFAAFLVGATSDAHPQLLPYLLAPPLIAGLAGGVFPLVTAILCQTVGTVLLTSDELTVARVGERAEFFAPWLVISLGVGLLGAWLREIGLGPAAPSVDRSYESARRLVGQLRSVARRLSGGLDPVAVATRLLGLIASVTGASNLAVFIRTEGGVLAPLAYHGPDAREYLTYDDGLMMQCWEESEPIHGRSPLGSSRRLALPLRVGSRMIGVVLADGLTAEESLLDHVMREVDDVALRLETALAFDEVRALATVEERRRLAREIHDGIAQEIASLGYFVDDLRSETQDVRTQLRLADLRAELTRMVSELRLSIFDLRSDVESGTTLGTALSDYVQQVGARSSMTVHLTLDESPTRLRGEVETELLRIVQEAVTNARKHSSASNLWVDCRVRAPWARISVRDDGAGLGTGRRDSYGIRIMRERADRIGGQLDVENQSGAGCTGTVVTVSVGDRDPAERRRHVPDSDRAAR